MTDKEPGIYSNGRNSVAAARTSKKVKTYRELRKTPLRVTVHA